MSYPGAMVSRRRAIHQVDDLLLRLSNGHAETDLSLDEYFDEWLASREATIASSTSIGYRTCYSIYIGSHLGKLSLTQINVGLLAEWIDLLLSAGSRTGGTLSARTVNYARILLHKMFEDAVTAGYVLVNPVARTRGPIKDREGQRTRYPASAWTIDELRRFLTLTDTHRSGPLFTLLAMTGMRRGEALALSWEDVDVDRSEVVISRSLHERDGEPVRAGTKSGRRRRIALGQVALDALELEEDRQRSRRIQTGREWANHENLIFTRPDGRFLRPMMASDAFRRTVAKSGLPRIRLHDLRHTHAILLLHAGVAVTDVSHRLGHADPAVTLKLYAHALRDPGHAVAATFDQLVTGRAWPISRPSG